jgi:hypothetical protein
MKWQVEPDQASHGAALAIMNEQREVVLRTPDATKLGARDSARDSEHAQIAAAAPDLLRLGRALVRLELYWPDHPHKMELMTELRTITRDLPQMAPL